MKLIKKLIISLIFIVAILGVVVIGGYIYIRKTYGIDLFRTTGQLKTLTKEVDESIICPNLKLIKKLKDLSLMKKEKVITVIQ